MLGRILSEQYVTATTVSTFLLLNESSDHLSNYCLVYKLVSLSANIHLLMSHAISDLYSQREQKKLSFKVFQKVWEPVETCVQLLSLTPKMV